jgi:hypothetical protein
MICALRPVQWCLLELCKTNAKLHVLVVLAVAVPWAMMMIFLTCLLRCALLPAQWHRLDLYKTNAKMHAHMFPLMMMNISLTAT